MDVVETEQIQPSETASTQSYLSKDPSVVGEHSCISDVDPCVLGVSLNSVTSTRRQAGAKYLLLDTGMILNSMTTPSAWRSLHHCSFTQDREDAASRRQVNHFLDGVLLSIQSSSVGHVRTGRLVSDQFESLIPNVRENPCRGSENEQIRILLERQKQEILSYFQAEIRNTNSRPIMTEQVSTS